jgi:hypothetical protein
MPDKPRKLPRRDNFASFDAVQGAGGSRRKPTWSLCRADASANDAKADVARRLVGEAELLQGLGRRPE